MNTIGNRLAESYHMYQLMKKKLGLIGLLFIMLLVMFSVFYFCKTATAQRSDIKMKTVTSVEVKNGDSLWSIASEYYTDEFDNMKEYIDEIKETNRLASDTIHAGNYIIVPYYTDALR